ncbi:hypothetical protein [Streptomyces sp. NPDC051636]|uniref:hypothetical protein n=1 Tax=Streptomyces sp. NPDC051636 TaxID=3365663 RepID=UPI0037A16AD7
MSADGSVVALATTNRLFVHRPGVPATEWSLRNRLEFLRPGCRLAVSPSGAHVACAGFRELLVRRIVDRSLVLRRAFSERDSRGGLGAKAMRLLCTDDGRVLWLRRGRLCQATDSPGIRHREQAGRYDDFPIPTATRSPPAAARTWCGCGRGADDPDGLETRLRTVQKAVWVNQWSSTAGSPEIPKAVSW